MLSLSVSASQLELVEEFLLDDADQPSKSAVKPQDQPAESLQQALDYLEQEMPFGHDRDWWEHRLDKALEPFPKLTPSILALLADAKVSGVLKRILLRALISEVPLFSLSPALKKRFQLDNTANAVFVEVENPERTWRLKATNEANLNSQIAKKANLKAMQENGVADRAIMSPDGAPAYKNDPFSILLHEMAHLRFSQFLDRHAATFAKRLPDCLARKDGDVWEFNKDFIDFINERYALEVEYQAVLSEPGIIPSKAYYKGTAWAAGEKWRNVRPEQSQSMIEQHVLAVYKIKAPAVLALVGHSIGELLLGDFGNSKPCRS